VLCRPARTDRGAVSGDNLVEGHIKSTLLTRDIRVHFTCNQLQRVRKAHQGIVTAALQSVFALEKASEIETHWDDLASSLAERFPMAVDLMHKAREDVLAFRHFPHQHWRKVWITNLLERDNE
jgi:putative transposase